jgi:membrane-associated protein
MLTTLFYTLFGLDQSLLTLAGQYGPWIYAILFLVIFAETGLVVFPFLPGDSILFIAGTLVASAGLNVHLLVGALITSPIHAGSGKAICAARRRSTTSTAG